MTKITQDLIDKLADKVLREANRKEEKTFEQWQELRRTNPSRYYSPTEQARMVQDRQALGNSFYEEGN